MAVTTTPNERDPYINYEPYTPPAPKLGMEAPKSSIEEEPMACVLDMTFCTICDTNSILLEICNSLECAGLLKDPSGEVRSPGNFARLVFNTHDAAQLTNDAAKLIRRILLGGEF